MKDKYYRTYNFFDIEKEKNFDKTNLTLISHFKTLQQKGDANCGPCCAIMLLNHYGDFRFKEEDVALLMKTKKFPKGTNFNHFYNFFKNLSNKEGKFKVFSNFEYKKLHKHKLIFPTFEKFKIFILDKLKRNIPVIVENVDYGGHYKIIIGYDEQSKSKDEDDMLIFCDPQDVTDEKCDGYNYFPADRFYYMWFDNHCFSKKYRKQPFLYIEYNN